MSATCKSLTNCDDHRTNWGVAFGKTHGALGFEEEIGYAKHFFGDTPGSDNAVLTIMSNLMVIVPAGPIRPYGLVGLGLMRPHFSVGTSALNVTKNSLGYDFGGGLNIFFTRGFGVRGDLRHLQTTDNFTFGLLSDEKLSFWRGSAALVFSF